MRIVREEVKDGEQQNKQNPAFFDGGGVASRRWGRFKKLLPRKRLDQRKTRLDKTTSA